MNVKKCKLCEAPLCHSGCGEWYCPLCDYSIKEPMICGNCGKREATQNWVGEGGTLAWSHGMSQCWCEICCTFEQLKYAKKIANGIPELEKKLNDLIAAELKDED